MRVQGYGPPSYYPPPTALFSGRRGAIISVAPRPAYPKLWGDPACLSVRTRIVNSKGMPSREALETLRSAGKTRDQMAAEFGVSLATMKRWIGVQDVGRRMSARRAAAVMKAERAKEKSDQFPLPSDDGIGLMERVKDILGSRMSEDYRGYLLDGRPCSSRQLIVEAEKVAGHTRH